MAENGYKILIGDPDIKTLVWMRKILLEEGFGVWTTSEPGDFMRIYESGNFNLVILDIKTYAEVIPQGFQIGSLDAQMPPVIIMTTDEDFPLTVDAIGEGAVDFLDKPIKVKRLLITLRNALQHSSKMKQLQADQEELKSLKELYEKIINGIDYGIVVLDQNLRIESINDHQRKKQHKDNVSAIGRPCYKFFYDKNTICDECRIREVFALGKPVSYNLVHKSIGGGCYYLEVEAFPLFDTMGKVNRVVQLIKDVSERVHLEKELWAKKEYLENLVAHAPVGIFTTDKNGYIRTANPAFVELLGALTPLNAIGMNVLKQEEFINLGLAQRFKDVLEEGLELEIGAINCYPAWGKEHYCSLRCAPLRGEENTINGIIAIVGNVTEKVRLEDSYRKRITELSIFKEIGDLLQNTIELSDIYTIALIGVTAGRGLGFNRAFLLRYDRSANALIGETAIGPSDASEAGRIWSDLYEKDLSINEIFENYKKSVEEKDVQVKKIVRNLKISLTWEAGFLQEVLFHNAPQKVLDAQANDSSDQKVLAKAIGTNTFAVVPLICRGKSEGILVADNLISGKDISDEDVNRLSIIANQVGAAIENSQLLQRLEEKIEALRQAYRDLKENRDLLVRAERLSVVGEVAATVAHEIRNPLTSIGGFTRAVLRDLEKSEKVQTNRRFLTIIMEEVKRLERIVNEILGYVRPVKPKFAYKDINEAIDQTFSMMEGEIDENLFIITKDFQKDLPQVWLDEDQIRQVLLNLFRNAFHAMKYGGMLSVITMSDADSVKIHVSDTGEGIPEEHKDKLFTAFFTTKTTGSGLGLTVSMQIIKNHGGTIAVDSKEGEGSTFIVTLPIRSLEDHNEETNSGRRRREESAHPL
ncbi:MAG: ATP-binding protein [bacterium]|nr:ATP-binding protein [bacterium]